MKNISNKAKQRIAYTYAGTLVAAAAVFFGTGADYFASHEESPGSSSSTQTPPPPSADQAPPAGTTQTSPPSAAQLPPPPPPSPADDPFSLDPAAHNNFLYALGTSESTGTRESGWQGGDYGSKNDYDCAGRWQFCPTYIDGPGFGKYKNDYTPWLRDPAYQNEMMEAYTRNHWNDIVRFGLTRFLGQTVPSSSGPVYVTAAGMLGGSHLGGIGRLQEFLESGINRPDAGGTTVADYMIRFKDTVVPDDWVRMPDAQPAPGQRAPAPSV